MGLDNIQNYIIGTILFILVVTGGIYLFGSFYSGHSDLDPTGDMTTFNKTMQLASNVTTSVNKLNETLSDVTDTETSFAGLGWLNALVGSAFNGLKAVANSISFMFIAGSEIFNYFGMPSFVFPLIVLVVIVIIVFAIWSAIMRV